MYPQYSANFKGVTISAAQDLVSLKGVGLYVGRVRKIWIGLTPTTLATAQSLSLNLKKSTATFTAGSGGGAMTPRPLNTSAAATITARINDTTPGTTSGAFTDIMPVGCHIYGGFFHDFGLNGPTFGLNEGIIWELLSTVTGTCVFSGGIIFDQIG